MIRSYRLQLDWDDGRYIITGDEWFAAGLAKIVLKEGDKPKFIESIGNAIIYPEHDLLWISVGGDKTERFKTLENFEKEFSSLPRWGATQYAVIEVLADIFADYDDDGDYGPERYHYGLFLFDCRTGQRLVDDKYPHKPVPGREAEVARLRRGIELLMRGETFSFM